MENKAVNYIKLNYPYNTVFNLFFKEPQKVVLGSRNVFRKRGNKRPIVSVEDCLYIPLMQSIQVQLSSPRILAMVLSGPLLSSSANVLRDFCDGTFWQNHALFSNDETALKILLYYDDVNLCNPLTNKVHKITLFYYQLANINIEYRSKLNAIHLLGVCKTCDLKKHGITKAFKPLVEELKILGSRRGYRFRIFDGEIVLRGALLGVLADTPASNLGAGFKESVGGARRKCRHCMTDYEKMQEFFTEEDFTLRNAEDHEEHLKLIENAPTKFLKEYYSKLFGVNERSGLEDAPYFDVCNQFPQDIMHVFLEGILAYEIKYLLRFHISENRDFTLDELNNAIQNFPYGYSS